MIHKTDFLTHNATGNLSNTNLLTQTCKNLIWLSGTALYKHGFHLKSQGHEHLPQNNGYLIAANHNSHLDGPAIIAALGQHLNQVYSLAAQDYFFNHPIKSWLCHNCFNMIPFNRKGKFIDCISTCKTVIEQGKTILFFPEGTRSVTGELQPLKLGLGRLVVELKVPVVPVYIQGTHKILPKGTFFPKKHSIQVRFGEPLSFKGLQKQPIQRNNHENYRVIAQKVYTAIQTLRDTDPDKTLS